jgi:hypothetical protein
MASSVKTASIRDSIYSSRSSLPISVQQRIRDIEHGKHDKKSSRKYTSSRVSIPSSVSVLQHRLDLEQKSHLYQEENQKKQGQKNIIRILFLVLGCLAILSLFKIYVVDKHTTKQDMKDEITIYRILIYVMVAVIMVCFFLYSTLMIGCANVGWSNSVHRKIVLAWVMVMIGLVSFLWLYDSYLYWIDQSLQKIWIVRSMVLFYVIVSLGLSIYLLHFTGKIIALHGEGIVRMEEVGFLKSLSSLIYLYKRCPEIRSSFKRKAFGMQEEIFSDLF